MPEKPAKEISITAEERLYLERLALNLSVAEKQFHAAVGMLAIAKGAGNDWQLSPDRSRFVIGGN